MSTLPSTFFSSRAPSASAGSEGSSKTRKTRSAAARADWNSLRTLAISFDGARKLARIQHEGGDAAHARDDAVHIHERAEDADERERKIVHKVDGRARDRAVALRFRIGIRRGGVLFFEARKEGLLAAVRFRRLLPRDDLLDKAVELAQLFGAGAEERLHLMGEPTREQRRERDGDREHRDKEGCRQKHHHKRPDDGDDARQNHHDVVRERFAQRVEVVREHGDDVARLTRVEIGDGQRHELGKEIGADALDDAARKIAQPDRREIRKDARSGVHPRKHGGVPPDRRKVGAAVGLDLVDGIAAYLRAEQGEHRPRKRRKKDEEKEREIRLCVFKRAARHISDVRTPSPLPHGLEIVF